MKTETLSCVPTGAVSEAGVIGQEAAPDATRQTTPVVATVTEMLTVWDNVPLVPVTCREKVPVMFVVMVRVAVPEPVMLVGFTSAPIPLG